MVFPYRSRSMIKRKGRCGYSTSRLTSNQAAIQLFVSIKSLGDEVVDYVPGDVGQAEISTAVMVSEFGVVNPQQMQNRCVQVVHVHRFLSHLEAEIIGGAVDESAFDAAAGHPHREGERVVIAAVLYPVSAHFDYRCAAEFGTADNQRDVEMAS